MLTLRFMRSNGSPETTLHDSSGRRLRHPESLTQVTGDPKWSAAAVGSKHKFHVGHGIVREYVVTSVSDKDCVLQQV